MHSGGISAAGKVPGVVYSNSDNRGDSPNGGVGRPADEPILVKVDKVVLDREIRRLNASFDNTVRENEITLGVSVPYAH